VKHFIQLPFGDNYCVEPEEPRAALAAARGSPGNKAGIVSTSLEEAVLSNGGVASVSASGAADADAATPAHDLVSPFTDSSHPLFTQVIT